ncbi:MAG: CsgG/HfaB family protein [Bacteroidetes bacterium]|nr:CsgG/HfaB family protein [Bacteroidota bacterium]
MSQLLRFVIGLVAITLFSVSLRAQQVVAVMNFNNNGSPDNVYLQNGLADMLTTTLATSQQIRLVERIQLEKVTQELQLGLSGLVDEQTAVEVSRLTGAKYVVLGAFMNLGKAIRIDAKVVETETAMIVQGATANAKASSVETADEAVDELAKVLLTTLPVKM